MSITTRSIVEELYNLPENGKAEIVNGEIIIMSPIGYRHATAVTLLNKFFVRRSRDRYEVTPGNPFILDDRSEPQPDILLVEPVVVSQGHHPGPDQIFLAIEVADSTLHYDREDKRPAYARGGVREYWILNLEQNVLEVYRDPSGAEYRQARVLGIDERVAPLSFPDVELRVGDFVP